MNEKIKYLAGILVFGSLWGISECYIGSYLYEVGLSSGAIMTGVFAIIFLVSSRMIFKKPGMQLGIGLVAGSLRLFNPFVGCHICSALAIMAEGALFELIWYKISLNFSELKNSLTKISMGILSAYILYIAATIITQILTPIVSGDPFFIENLIVFLPAIFSKGLIAALLGGIVLPIIFFADKLDLTIKDRIYYPATIGISCICWFIVLGNWLFA
jgi:hypothetical protein